MKKKAEQKNIIGGQALIEGIYMRGPKKGCVAVRKPDGDIFTETEDISVHPLRKVPFLRGAVLMVDNLVKGYKSIMKSADIAFEEEEASYGGADEWISKKLGDKGFSAAATVAAVLGGLFSIVLFLIAPTFIVGFIDGFFPLGGFKALAEGILKILIFIGYLFLVTRIKDIRRVFEYHGAEHKAIACYEAKNELTAENVRLCSRFHPRCGTSFLFLVVIISIAIFSFVPFANTLARAGVKLLLIPVIMGIAYEVTRYAGMYGNRLSSALSAPGLWVQRLTTFEPDDSQIEVAIAAIKMVIPQHETADDAAL